MRYLISILLIVLLVGCATTKLRVEPSEEVDTLVAGLLMLEFNNFGVLSGTQKSDLRIELYELNTEQSKIVYTSNKEGQFFVPITRFGISGSSISHMHSGAVSRLHYVWKTYAATRTEPQNRLIP